MEFLSPWHSLCFWTQIVLFLKTLNTVKMKKRFYCLGKVSDAIMTVRFTYRKNKIRIIGAGYWRQGKKIYERENQIHRRTNGES